MMMKKKKKREYHIYIEKMLGTLLLAVGMHLIE